MSKINRNPAEENLMNQTDKIKETDLYPPVKKWLEDQGFEVFPEVQIYWGANIMDIVAIKGDTVITVEMKTSFSLKVIQQAHENKNYCNYSYVAVPYHLPKIDAEGKYRRGSDHEFACKICQSLGVGVLRIETEKRFIPDPEDNGKFRSLDGRWENILVANLAQSAELQKGFLIKQVFECCNEARRKYQEETGITAGSNKGGHLTAYKTSILNMIEYLSSRPEGASIKEIAQNVKLHWERPSVSIPQAIKKWESKTFEIRQENGKNKVFLIS